MATAKNKETEKPVGFFRYLTTGSFIKNLLLAALLVIIMISVALWALKGYTRHGEARPLPNFIGVHINDIYAMGDKADLEIIITDSVYDSKSPKGTIVTQVPDAGSLVKRGRKVYLTSVAILPEIIEMPNLVDMTLRQAQNTLDVYGLQLGKLSYVPDIAENAVLAQLVGGSPIRPGEKIEKGALVDLNVGTNGGSAIHQIPFLIGLTRQQALDALKKHYLQIGGEIYNDDSDSINGRVYIQYPEYVKGVMVTAGQQITLVYKNGNTFDFNTYVKQFKVDSADYQSPDFSPF